MLGCKNISGVYQMTDQHEALIIRSPRGSDSPYFATARRAAQDMSLTYEARGMLWYLLSKPDNWETRIGDLMQDYARKDKTYNILRELREHGYITRPRSRNAGGSWVWGDYRVHESPVPENERTLYNRPVPAIPDTVNPVPESPDTALPDTANPDINTNKRVLKKKDSKKKENKESGAEAARNTLIGAIVEVWVKGWAGAVSGNPYSNKTYRVDAGKLADSTSLDDIKRYTLAKAADKRWVNQRPSWGIWFNDLGAWLAANPAQPEPGKKQYGSGAELTESQRIALANMNKVMKGKQTP